MPRWSQVKDWILVAAIVASFFYGQRIGAYSAETRYSKAVAEAQTKVIQAAELASRKEADRIAAEAARASLALQLEDQARAEIPSNPVCLPVSRVLRLNQR